jgi:hypothetical protein
MHEEASMSITAIILTYNESRHIARAIRSIRAFTDSSACGLRSTDGTEIARQCAPGAHARLVNQAKKFQCNRSIQGQWYPPECRRSHEPDLAVRSPKRCPSWRPTWA